MFCCTISPVLNSHLARIPLLPITRPFSFLSQSPLHFRSRRRKLPSLLRRLFLLLFLLYRVSTLINRSSTRAKADQGPSRIEESPKPSCSKTTKTKVRTRARDSIGRCPSDGGFAGQSATTAPSHLLTTANVMYCLSTAGFTEDVNRSSVSCLVVDIRN